MWGPFSFTACTGGGTTRGQPFRASRGLLSGDSLVRPDWTYSAYTRSSINWESGCGRLLPGDRHQKGCRRR